MTIFMKCDMCGTTEEFVDEHYFSSGWHLINWKDMRNLNIMEKHLCDSCWKKIKEGKE